VRTTTDGRARDKAFSTDADARRFAAEGLRRMAEAGFERDGGEELTRAPARPTKTPTTPSWDELDEEGVVGVAARWSDRLTWATKLGDADGFAVLVREPELRDLLVRATYAAGHPAPGGGDRVPVGLAVARPRAARHRGRPTPWPGPPATSLPDALRSPFDVRPPATVESLDAWLAPLAPEGWTPGARGTPEAVWAAASGRVAKAALGSGKVVPRLADLLDELRAAE
jgi:hypothetical protein